MESTKTGFRWITEIRRSIESGIDSALNIAFKLRSRAPSIQILERTLNSPIDGPIAGKDVLSNSHPHSPSHALEIKRYEKILHTLNLPRDLTHIYDVGCRDWGYLRSLTDYFPKAEIVGFEVDAYRGGQRRIQSALSNIRAQSTTPGIHHRQIQYVDRDFRLCNSLPSGAKAAVLFLFPFVSPGPCRAAGLPSQYADFQSLLNHALSLVAHPAEDTDGFPNNYTASTSLIVASCHQGRWESDIAKKAYQACEAQAQHGRLTGEQLYGFPIDVELWTSSPVQARNYTSSTNVTGPSLTDATNM